MAQSYEFYCARAEEAAAAAKVRLFEDRNGVPPVDFGDCRIRESLALICHPDMQDRWILFLQLCKCRQRDRELLFAVEGAQTHRKRGRVQGRHVRDPSQIGQLGVRLRLHPETHPPGLGQIVQPDDPRPVEPGVGQCRGMRAMGRDDNPDRSGRRNLKPDAPDLGVTVPDIREEGVEITVEIEGIARRHRPGHRAIDRLARRAVKHGGAAEIGADHVLQSVSGHPLPPVSFATAGPPVLRTCWIGISSDPARALPGAATGFQPSWSASDGSGPRYAPR